MHRGRAPTRLRLRGVVVRDSGVRLCRYYFKSPPELVEGFCILTYEDHVDIGIYLDTHEKVGTVPQWPRWARNVPQ
jgi:hypothetical protein